MTLAQIIASLKAILQADAAKTVLPILANFFSSVAANPSAVNFAVADAKLVADLLAALPSIEQDLLKQLATDLSAAATNLMTNTKGA
nr:hypothetical protein [uncultured Rhodopila sp.]